MVDHLLMTLILFIYYNGHVMLLLLLLAKTIHILLHSRSFSYLFTNFLYSYQSVQVKSGKITGSRFEIIENFILYTLQGGFMLWVITIVVIKVMLIIFHLHQSA